MLAYKHILAFSTVFLSISAASLEARASCLDPRICFCDAGSVVAAFVGTVVGSPEPAASSDSSRLFNVEVEAVVPRTQGASGLAVGDVVTVRVSDFPGLVGRRVVGTSSCTAKGGCSEEKFSDFKAIVDADGKVTCIFDEDFRLGVDEALEVMADEDCNGRLDELGFDVGGCNDVGPCFCAAAGAGDASPARGAPIALLGAAWLLRARLRRRRP